MKTIICTAGGGTLMFLYDVTAAANRDVDLPLRIRRDIVGGAIVIVIVAALLEIARAVRSLDRRPSDQELAQAAERGFNLGAQWHETRERPVDLADARRARSHE